ncbi:uncharacterized protein LOC141901850 [Tubulanus polymorphus]|uniref:uncharacterized protein LOC141901850 n=1 Tax=Tubulanus polymorphus TaxID=672921 RepID=UPI003DA29B9D
MMASASSAESESTVRERRARYEPPPGDWNPDLPYGGKVYLARKKKPDPLYIKILEVAVICFTVWLCYYSYYYIDHLQFHVTHAYAHLGFAEAQHQTGQRYMFGSGVEKHTEKAIDWYKKAADQGHPRAQYDLAVGHIKGHDTGLPAGHAHHLLHQAASQGVKEARDALQNVCSKGNTCDI